ncbi:MAG TPA: hypothetical protein VGD91_25505 [Trebonia sp.]
MTVVEYAAMDDPQLIAERARIRSELERLSPETDDRRSLACLYDIATAELDHRARLAWTTA